MTLGDAKVGTTVVVTKIEGDSAYKRRIMDMGITKGSELFIRKVAPLGDPVEITVTVTSSFLYFLFLILPSFFSTVTPGQFPTYWFAPVRALNSVVLPQFGFPC